MFSAGMAGVRSRERLQGPVTCRSGLELEMGKKGKWGWGKCKQVWDLYSCLFLCVSWEDSSSVSSGISDSVDPDELNTGSYVTSPSTPHRNTEEQVSDAQLQQHHICSRRLPDLTNPYYTPNRLQVVHRNQNIPTLNNHPPERRSSHEIMIQHRPQSKRDQENMTSWIPVWTF